MRRRSLVICLVLFVTLFMVLSYVQGSIEVSGPTSSTNNGIDSLGAKGQNASGLVNGLHYLKPNFNTSSPAKDSSTNWSSTGTKLVSDLNSLHIPQIAKLPPNFNVKPETKGSTVLPSYTSSPAPMGIGSYGLVNNSGTISSFTYSTNSFDGNFSLNSVKELYMDGDSGHSFSIQLNAVLNNVTLSGATGYQFWTQNVVDYSSSSHQLTFIDNVWNFSSPSAVMEKNTIHSGNGTVVPGLLYYDIGPTLNVSTPFTLNLFLNTANINQRNTVFFNYSLSYISKQGKHIFTVGSFDELQFNSTVSGSNAKIPIPEYVVSGSTLTKTGFIPMDAEMILGGEGGGSNAQFLNINGSMGLKYKNDNGTYENIKSAYDVGSQTGETSTGISEYFSGSTAYLNSGPSFINPLWNLSSNSGHSTLEGKLAPSNAFMFISQGGKSNNQSAQWSPVNLNGNFKMRLYPGIYSMEALMSYHTPQFKNAISLLSGNTVNLGTITVSRNNSTGLYTPFYAFNNEQLANLSISGSGTINNPFIVPGTSYFNAQAKNMPDRINGLFSEINDYLYPIFSGVLITNTTDHTIIEDMSGKGNNPAFQVVYQSSLLPILIEFFGVTSTNYLQMIFYESQNIIILNNTLSGWFSSVTFNNYTPYNIPPVAALMLWNVTGSLVERNSIESQGSGLLVYNNNHTDSGNYIWNNTFTDYSLISPGSLYGGAPIGLIVASSGNTIYNNEFKTIIPVVSLEGKAGNLYTGGMVTYKNRFNISREQPSYAISVLGQKLSGTIIQSPYEGGNYYYNYFGNGNESYNGTGVGFAFNGQGLLNGSINYAYDQLPLTLNGYAVNVNAQGLPKTVNGQITTYFDINNDIVILPELGSTIYLPNGTYSTSGIELQSRQILLKPVLYEGKVANPVGAFIVNGPMINLTFQYSELLNFTVSETGLPIGTLWGFSIPSQGEGFLSTENNVSFYILSGTYELLPQDAYGYEASNIPIVNISEPNEVVNINYVYSNKLVSLYSITFSESGLPSGKEWSVTLNGTAHNSTKSSITVQNLPEGNYSYSVKQVGGYNSVQGGLISLNYSRATVDISFTRSSSIPTVAYIFIAVSLIAGLFAGYVLFYLRYARKK